MLEYPNLKETLFKTTFTLMKIYILINQKKQREITHSKPPNELNSFSEYYKRVVNL